MRPNRVMPQTKFVLSKALKLGLKPIVVINKIDRSDAQPKETLESIFDLFLALEANDYQLDFHHLYASGRNGWAVERAGRRAQGSDRRCSSRIVEDVPPPKPLALAGDEHPFKMLVTTLEADNYLGRILTGRIESGAITINRQIKALNRDGEVIEKARVTKLLAFRGLARVPVERAEAGDIVAIAGLQTATVADTLCDLTVEEPIPATSHRSADLGDDHFGQRHSRWPAAKATRCRAASSATGCCARPKAMSRSRCTETGEGAFEVAGRGELQLGVLIESMRREGFELSISPPARAVQDREWRAAGADRGSHGRCRRRLYRRRDREDLAAARARWWTCAPPAPARPASCSMRPARGLIGYHGEFLTDTRGTGVMNRMFLDYAPHKGSVGGRINGVLISTERWRSGGLWPLVPGRARQAVRHPGHQGL